MTERSQSEQPRVGVAGDKILLGLLAIVILGMVLFLSSQQRQVLRSSPSGLDGLQVWLSDGGQEIQSFSGGWPLRASEIGLHVIPIYDTDLNEPRALPRTEAELILQQDEYDIDLPKIQKTAEIVPTLIVLPKWRSGMRLTSLAHPQLLNDGTLVLQIARDLVDDQNLSIRFSRTPFTTFEFVSQDQDSHEILIYAAQALSSDLCTPVIGTQEEMLLGECPISSPSGNTKAYVLSDPDFLNNHGLTLGENAFAARSWFAQVAGTERVIIDYSPENWLSDAASRPQRERTWADLMRFFEPPFLFMWAGLFLIVALTFWRSSVRFGPLLREQSSIIASKSFAIAARARLMRMSNSAGALAREYSKARLAETAARLLGPMKSGQYAPQTPFVAYVQRKHPDYAERLKTALYEIDALADNASAAQVVERLSALNRVLEGIQRDT